MAMDNPSDDDISLTSTVESDQASEYYVDTILAECEFAEDDMRYLVRWEGYNVLRSTWEPKESFNNVRETLLEWEDKKQRISEGKEQPFDVTAWEATCRRSDQEKEERKRRRSAKRRKIAASEERRNPTLVKNTATVGKAASQRSPNASTRRRPPGPSRSLYSEQGHPARQLAGLSVSRVPPVARFGTSQPASKSVRPKKGFSTDEGEQFATPWRKFRVNTYSKNKELQPNVDQVDIRPPSDWDSMPNVKAIQPGSSRQITDMNRGGPTENGPRPSLASSGLSHTQPQSPLASPRPDSDLWYASSSRNAERLRSDIAGTGGPVSSKPELNLKIPPREPSGYRPAAGKFDLEFRDRKPAGGYRTAYIPHTNSQRWWNKGEVYVNLYIGQDKREFADARLCGLPYVEAVKPILRTKQPYPPGKIEVWFRDQYTWDQYEKIRAEISNKPFANGWIEGFDDTESLIRPVAEQLWKENKIAIAQINPNQVLLAYPPGSVHFSFPGETVPPRGYLFLALRNIFGPIHNLRLNERISYPPLTEVNNALKNGHAELTMATVSSGQKASRNFNVAQGSIGQPSTASPKLTTPDTSTYAQSPTLNSPIAQFPNNISTTREIHASTKRTHLDIRPTKALPQGRTGSEFTETKAELSKEELDKLFLTRFGITFEKLTFSNGTDKRNQTKVFYIWYPDDSQAVKDEEKQLTNFLGKHKQLWFTNSTNRLDKGWEKFMNLVTGNTMHGVVLFHQSIVQYNKLPQLVRAIRRTTNFWKVSLAKPIQYLDPPLHVQRLFPHGGVYLLTEDFMVHEQVAAMIILQWFHEYSRKKNPGTYKLMLRPDIMNWLLNNMEVGDDSQRCRWFTMYHLVKQIGFNPNDDIIPGLEEDFIISPPTLPKYGFRTADDSPDIPKNCTQEQRNTDHLGEFFAGYALLNAHRFRRFYMITSLEHLERWKKWHHIEIGGYQDFLQFQSVKPELIHERLFKGTSAAFASADATPVSPAAPRPSKPSGGLVHEQRSVSVGNQLPTRYGQPYH
ncbi:putative Chromo domain protein Chp1p [Aspergillus mulundensis]|uniref:Chromo domain-containing protein n=1 Tax=Aspergillus mulundensis TaxID=1810919 RepID=A0A3D8R9J5_9EURO|nr:hypothetical protein DSM5745_08244 [Aspergillus mulundensis]RDW70733.1 hypothetical protein DSM5745_08244 [Aspergillus mulundensis]